MTARNKQPHADELFSPMSIATADLLLDTLAEAEPGFADIHNTNPKLHPKCRREFVIWLFTRCAFDKILAEPGINEARQAVQARLDCMMERIIAVDWNGSPSLSDYRMLAEAKYLYEALSPEAREEIPE